MTGPGPTPAPPTALGPGDLLVLRALGLGDLLTGIPALRGLRRRFPRARLLLAAPTPVGEFLRRRGIVDRVVETRGLEPLRAQGTGHLAVDLHGRGPDSRELLVATGAADVLGFATAGFDGPRWVRHEHEVRRWCRLVEAWDAACGPEDLRLRPRPTLPTGGPVLVHPGAASPARRWPVERWAAVVARLVDDGFDVVVTGTAQESPLGAALERAGARDLCGPGDLEALAGRVGGARLVLSGDTGTAHLATALGVPSVTLFGPTPPAWWGPALDPERHRVLWHGDPAARDYVGDPHGTVLDPTLARTTVEEVLSAAEAVLDGDGVPDAVTSGQEATTQGVPR